MGRGGAIGDEHRRVAFVILLVPKTSDHKGSLYISVANGAEGFFLDKDAGELTRANAELWRAKRYDEATFNIVTGVMAKTRARISQLAARDAEQAASPPARRSPPNPMLLVGGALVLAVVGIVLIIIARRIGRRTGGSRATRRAAWDGVDLLTQRRLEGLDAQTMFSSPDSGSSGSSSSSSSDSFGGDGGGFSGGGGGTEV